VNKFIVMRSGVSAQFLTLLYGDDTVPESLRNSTVSGSWHRLKVNVAYYMNNDLALNSSDLKKTDSYMFDLDKQLHSIAGEFCSDSYHIESQYDLRGEWFEGKNFCGISAGASTPDWIIDRVIEKIRSITL
jgi:hypothetical protein